MNIRSATFDDWQSVLTLLNLNQLPIADLDVSHVSNFLLAYDGQALLGTIAVQPFDTTGLLRSLAVDSGFRGEGVGKKLTQAAEIFARGNGISSLALLTTTAADFFERLGYQRTDRSQVSDEVQRTAEFARLCPASAVCMTKMLS